MSAELQGVAQSVTTAFMKQEGVELLVRQFRVAVSPRLLENGTGFYINLGFSTEAGARSFHDMTSDPSSPLRENFPPDFLRQLAEIPKISVVADRNYIATALPEMLEPR